MGNTTGEVAKTSGKKGSTSSKGKEPPGGNPKRKLTQEERTALSDKRMFDAAMELISEQGAHRTTLKQICEKAGYSRGLATYRFGSKDAFFDRLITDFNYVWGEELARQVGRKKGLKAILAALDAIEHFLTEHTRYMRGRYIIMYESIATDNVLSRRLRVNHNAYHSDIQGWVQQGIDGGEISPDTDPYSFASYYSSFIFGTIYQWLVNPEQIDVSSSCEFFRQQIVKGLAS